MSDWTALPCSGEVLTVRLEDISGQTALRRFGQMGEPRCDCRITELCLAVLFLFVPFVFFLYFALVCCFALLCLLCLCLFRSFLPFLAFRYCSITVRFFPFPFLIVLFPCFGLLLCCSLLCSALWLFVFLFSFFPLSVLFCNDVSCEAACKTFAVKVRSYLRDICMRFHTKLLA